MIAEYRFGPFTLDCRRQRLLRGEEPVPLTAKAYDVLLALVQRHGHVVSKDELLLAVWGDAAVTEGNLTQQIFTLRKLLGGESGAIVTVPRRGYRFVAEICHRVDAPAGLSTAQTAHLKARYFMNRRTPDGLRRAIEHLNRAIADDPLCSVAYADLAQCYSLDAATLLPRAERMELAKAAARKALDLDDTLAEAHVALASVAARWDWNWTVAEREFSRAIELDPSSAAARHGHALFLCCMGRFDEAIDEMRRASILDRLSPVFRVGIGRVLDIARRHDDAITEYERVLDVDPDFAEGHFDLAMALRHLERHQAALACDVRAVALAPDKPMYRGGLAASYALNGRRDEAQQEVDSLIATSRRAYVSPIVLAFAVLVLDDVNGALGYLDQAVAERSAEVLYLAVDPDCRPLWRESRFQTLIERIGLPPSARKF